MKQPLRLLCPLALALAACGGTSAPGVASVTLTAASTGPLVSLGQTRQITAAALDAKGAPVNVTVAFSSGAPEVAVIDGAGLVTAKSNGTATITASAGGHDASLVLTVAQVVASVTVAPATLRAPPGETPLFHARPFDALGSAVAGTSTPDWSSSNASVLTVASSGLGAVAAGAATGATATAIATISAIPSSSGGALTVDPAAVYVETLTVTSATSTTLTSLGQTLQLAATAQNPRQGDVSAQAAITWSSGDATIATVSSSGLVTAVKNGRATITAAANGASGSLQIIVGQVVATVVVTTANGGASASLDSLGQTAALSAVANDSNGNPLAGATFTWQSDGAAVATVDASGVVTAIKNGTAHVTAKSDAATSAGFTIAVLQKISFVDVTGGVTYLDVALTAQLSAAPRDGKGNLVAGAPAAVWSTGSAATATISAAGLVTGVARGAVTLTATVGTSSGTAKITVVPKPAIVDWGFKTATTTNVVTIVVGQAVIWHATANDAVAHTATADDKPPPSTGQLAADTDSAPQRFTAVGTVAYHCANHNYMKGTVVVTP